MLVDVGSVGHSDQVVLHLQTRHESCVLMRQEAQCAPNFGPKDLVGCTERPKTATTALYPIDKYVHSSRRAPYKEGLQSDCS